MSLPNCISWLETPGLAVLLLEEAMKNGVMADFLGTEKVPCERQCMLCNSLVIKAWPPSHCSEIVWSEDVKVETLLTWVSHLIISADLPNIIRKPGIIVLNAKFMALWLDGCHMTEFIFPFSFWDSLCKSYLLLCFPWTCPSITTFRRLFSSHSFELLPQQWRLNTHMEYHTLFQPLEMASPCGS